VPEQAANPQSTEPGQGANAEPATRKRIVSAAAISTLLSMAAVGFSAFSLWETRLKAPDLRMFVPPVIEYSAPYQNSNFEMIAVPITIANEGARAGTVLALELAVTDPKTNQTKLFYSANFGRWAMERTRSNAYQPFAPIVLAGYSSKTETVQFFTRGEEQQPPQIIRETQAYQFTLKLDQAIVQDLGPIDRMLVRGPVSISFERLLRYYDARAFNAGTLPLYAADWRPTVSGKQGTASAQ
jgi:hypothetical protein